MSLPDEMQPKHQGLLKGKGQKAAPVRVPFPVNKKLIDEIIYPVKTKRGIVFGKNKR